MRRSGSWFSNAGSRRCAFSQTQPTGAPRRRHERGERDQRRRHDHSHQQTDHDARAGHHVDELRRLQRQVGALDEPAERSQRRVSPSAFSVRRNSPASACRRSFFSFASSTASASARCASAPGSGRGRRLAEVKTSMNATRRAGPRAARARSSRPCRRRPPAAARRASPPRPSQRSERARSRGRARHLRDELRRLSRPAGRDVVEPPGPLQLVGELGVDPLERAGDGAP